jgi:drug/metabolite transporter (DMT)-like permease
MELSVGKESDARRELKEGRSMWPLGGVYLGGLEQLHSPRRYDEVGCLGITALCFGVAALLLLPLVLRGGIALDRVGWPALTVMVAGAGAPYVMLAAAGLRFAPAPDQAALNPRFAPLFVAINAQRLIVGREPAIGQKRSAK